MTGLSWQAIGLVALGGAAGSALRHLVGLAATGWLGVHGVWGTLAVNLAGSLAIGLAAGVEGGARLLLVTGLLGGFTTFSAFTLEAATLGQRAPGLAVAYGVASVAGGLVAFAVGARLAR